MLIPWELALVNVSTYLEISSALFLHHNKITFQEPRGSTKRVIILYLPHINLITMETQKMGINDKGSPALLDGYEPSMQPRGLYTSNITRLTTLICTSAQVTRRAAIMLKMVLPHFSSKERIHHVTAIVPVLTFLAARLEGDNIFKADVIRVAGVSRRCFNRTLLAVVGYLKDKCW